MLRIADNGLVYYHFESLTPFVGRGELRYGIFTRLGGVSDSPFATLNTGHMVGDDPQAVEENHRRICRALDADPASIATGYQVHGASTALIDLKDRGRVRPATDILLTDRPGIPLMQRFADCTPLILYDPMRRVLGLAHAGWRGTVQGVALEAVQAMNRAFGSRPADIVAGVGPAIGPCCYEIGPEVAEQVRGAFSEGDGWLLHCAERSSPWATGPGTQGTVPQDNGALYLDLWTANREQLQAAGVGQVEEAGLCTACHTGEFFSHRAENGRTGRFGLMGVLSE